jgi:ABC-2 type transport system ATP-binding protein
MDIIIVKDLVKRYDNFTAVDHISFNVQQGTIFGLLGSNGAGKTSTLEILETLHNKNEGQVIINGFDLDKDVYNIKKIIGVQLQASGYYPHLNLIELLDLFAGLYKVKINPYEILERIGLVDKAKNKFKELSGGQQQKFSIATTIIHKPKIVFLDEPTTGLDPLARRQLWEQILELKNNGTTIVITTHYLDEAEYLCDSVAIMDKGIILKMDTPNNLIDELINAGFKRATTLKGANLEDVFIHLTGKQIY